MTQLITKLNGSSIAFIKLTQKVSVILDADS